MSDIEIQRAMEARMQECAELRATIARVRSVLDEPDVDEDSHLYGAIRAALEEK